MNASTTRLAKQLVAIPSTADRPQSLHEALGLLRARLDKVNGIGVKTFASNGKPSLLAYNDSKQPKRFKVILNGHLDVVPGRPEQFTPTERDGRLYGRGALDMKTAAVLLTEVFCEVAPLVEYSLGLQLVTDEEVGGAHGTGYQVAQGVEADFMLAGEFTPSGAICNESRGICWAEVEFKGRTAHSAYLWNGNNTILQANDYVAKLLRHYPVPKAETWATTVNIATIVTPNTTFNQVPDSAKIGIDIRYVASDPHFASHSAAETFLQALAPSATVRIIEFEPSHYADPQNPFLRALATSIKQEGGTPTFIRKHGAADVRYYSSIGVPAVVFGLEGSGLHSDTEYVELSSIQQYKNTLKRFLLSLKA